MAALSTESGPEKPGDRGVHVLTLLYRAKKKQGIDIQKRSNSIVIDKTF